MSKKRSVEDDPILPTNIELYDGVVTDPRGHEDEITNAVHVLHRFCDDLSAVSLMEVHRAALVLGNYSGYPQEAYEFDSYLDSEYAQASYRTVAEHLPQFIANMLSRIDTRIRLLSAQEESKSTRSTPEIDEDDIPF